MEHVRWLGQPTLHRPKLIAAFTGWNDAADAASNSVRHMVEAWSADPLAEIDPEEFTDFATVRPHVRLTPDQRRTIVWPTVGLWSASTPGGDVILLLGPEPALRWRLFTEQLLAIAEKFEVSLVITLGALLADVPHSRPVHLIGTSTDQATIDRFDLQRSRYEGPTGIVGVMQDACAREGYATASLWAAVPAYASQLPSPKAALALVQRACDMIGTPAPTGGLQADADGYDTRVTALVADDADLIGYVARLETLSDTGELDDYDFDLDDVDSLDDDVDLADDDDDDDDTVGGELGDGDSSGDDAGTRSSRTTRDAAGPATEVDSDELMAEVERFLRDQGSDS